MQKRIQIGEAEMTDEKYLIIDLVKADEKKHLVFKFKKLRQKAHAAKELGKFLKKGWQLAPVNGLSGNADFVHEMKQLLGDYKPGDRLPVKKMMAATGLQAMPHFLRKKLEKEEGDNEQKTNTSQKEET